MNPLSKREDASDITVSSDLHRVRLCVIDVDGTLLDSRHRVSAHTVEAVAQARRRGLQILLATSRGPKALKPVLAEIPSLTGEVFIGSQGAVTARYGEDGHLVVISQQQMAAHSAHSLVRIADDHGIAVSWYFGEHWYVSYVDHTVEREADIVGVAPDIRDLFTLVDGPDKLMLVAPDGDPRSLVPVIDAIPPDVRAQVSNPTYLEITRHDVDKAHAVAQFCADSHIDAAEVLAIGDGPNDLGMFAFAGTSVAPANARPEVCAAADFTTPSNDNDGVANVLNALAHAG